MQTLIFKDGKQIGPFTISEIEAGIAEGRYSPEDYAWQDGFTDWVPLSELVSPTLLPVPIEAEVIQENKGVASAWRIFVADEQDPGAVSKIFAKLTEILTRDEEIDYIGVQKKPVMTLSPDAIVVTNKRLLIYRPGLMGVTFEDYAWREVYNVHMSEQILGATITCQTTAGRKAEINHLPKRQARRIYSYAQEIEEWMVKKRRENELERLRATAGGVVVQNALSVPPAQPPLIQQEAQQDDPVSVLSKLKKMLDGGLIEQQEYDAKKAEILRRM